jgi:SAM-dependent methyltransferase
MTHEEKIARWIGPGKMGTEIGPGAAPLPGFSPPPIYVDRFARFADSVCRADYFGDACNLPFHDHALDYVAASHVLEHVANPVAALAEWYRVLRPGGIIYVVVPDRRATWEHARQLTPVEHLLDDYVHGTTPCDSTHIDEFVYEADWSQFSLETAPEDVPARQAELARGMHAAVAEGKEINIHFHTFEPPTFRALLERLTWPEAERQPASAPGCADSPGVSIPRMNWEIVDFAERFPRPTPNGILAVLRVHKGWRVRADLEARRLRREGKSGPALKDDAMPFAEWAARNTVPAPGA